MGLKDFPHFSSEAALIRALKDQSFVVSDRTKSAARRVTNSATGNSVFVHPASIVARSGHRARNDLAALVSIGFVPPSQPRKT